MDKEKTHTNKRDEVTEVRELAEYECLCEEWNELIKRGEIINARRFMRKIEKKIEEYDERRNFSKETKEWVLTSIGWFSTSNIFNGLHVTSRQEKKNVVLTLLRLKDKGILEHHPKRNGVYRRIETELFEMDYKGAIVKPVKINWPLDINSLFVTYPKNIIVIAGTKDSGKTTFMLDLIKRNQDSYKINYFSNEMGEEELKMRLLLHKDMTIDDWKIKAYERGDNYSDVIQPNHINIVDWLELTDNFFGVAGVIKEIHEKLDKGIAVIALQKEFGAQLAVGRGYTLRRPRLYITLEGGIAKVISAKHWRDTSDNPVGKILEYKIIGGWDIRPQGVWHNEYLDSSKRRF